jgi:hypothetical protein
MIRYGWWLAAIGVSVGMWACLFWTGLELVRWAR